jgi:hypothetical protein
MKKIVLISMLTFSASFAHASWQYWGTAPDGVTELCGDDFGYLSSPDGKYSGALGVSPSSGFLRSNNGRSWDIVNGHYYRVSFEHGWPP